jgi:hypothetical protein
MRGGYYVKMDAGPILRICNAQGGTLAGSVVGATTAVELSLVGNVLSALVNGTTYQYTLNNQYTTEGAYQNETDTSTFVSFTDITVFGPWSYDLKLPPITIADTSVGMGFSATLVPNKSVVAGYGLGFGFQSTLAPGRVIASDFGLGFGMQATLIQQLGVGPWSYDLSLPALALMTADFASGLGFNATLARTGSIVAGFSSGLGLNANVSRYSVIATGVSDALYADSDVNDGVTYRYRVTDALGNVVYSEDVTAIVAAMIDTGVITLGEVTAYPRYCSDVIILGKGITCL